MNRFFSTFAITAVLASAIAGQAQAQPGYPKWEAVRAAAVVNGGGSTAVINAPKSNLKPASHLLGK